MLRFGVLALVWGSGFLWMKLALRGLSPLQVVLGRLVLGAAVMLIVVATGRHRLPRGLVPWIHLTVMAVAANIVPSYLFGWALGQIASSLAGILLATAPLFTLGFALATGLERLSLPRLGGLVAGFIGVLVLAAPWQRAAPDSSVAGLIACLLGAACYGASYVYARRFLTGWGLSPLVLSTGQVAAGAVLLVLASPVVAHQPVTLTPTVVASVLVLGAGGTGMAYMLNYRLIADEGAVTASTVMYLLPLVAVALGALVLQEPLTWNVLAGAILVLAGVAVSEGRLGRFVQQAPPKPKVALGKKES